jgi:hypothetical protein
METEGTLPHSQEPATSPILSQISPLHTLPPHVLKTHFKIILPSTSGFFKWFLSLICFYLIESEAEMSVLQWIMQTKRCVLHSSWPARARTCSKKHRLTCADCILDYLLKIEFPTRTCYPPSNTFAVRTSPKTLQTYKTFILDKSNKRTPFYKFLWFCRLSTPLNEQDIYDNKAVFPRTTCELTFSL